MATPEYARITNIAIVFEAIVIVISLILLVLILKRYLKKRNEMTLLLFGTFLWLSIGIFFSWLSKIIWLYLDGENISEGADFFWIQTQIMGFRFSLAAIILGAIISYVQKEKLFQEERKKSKDIFSIIFGFVCFLACVLLPRDYDLISFLIAFIYVVYVYLPFAVQTGRVTKTLEKGHYQSAFKYLTIMAVSFMLIFLCFFSDNLTNSMLEAQDGNQHGYSIFYYFGWGLALLGMWSAYLGYIRPGGKPREE